MASKRPIVAKAVLKKKNIVGRYILPHFKPFDKLMVIKTVCVVLVKNRRMDQRNRMERPEIDPHN